MAWCMLWPGLARHGISWLAWHGIWYGLEGMTWYVVCPDGHGMVYGMAWRAWHGKRYGMGKGIAWEKVWSGGHGIVYGMTWTACHWFMVWSGGHGMVYSMALWAWQGIWYDLAGIACYMVYPGAYGMVYGMAWWASYGLWYGLVYRMALYMVWSSGHAWILLTTKTLFLHQWCFS